MNLYRCKHCKKVVGRQSEKRCINSFCGEKGKMVRLMKIGSWTCACVKRYRKGDMTHIALHPETTKQCPKCKAKRPQEGLQ